MRKEAGQPVTKAGVEDGAVDGRSEGAPYAAEEHVGTPSLWPMSRCATAFWTATTITVRMRPIPAPSNTMYSATRYSGVCWGQRGQQGDADGQEHRPDHRIALVAAVRATFRPTKTLAAIRLSDCGTSNSPESVGATPVTSWRNSAEGHRPDEAVMTRNPVAFHDPEYRVAARA